MDRLDVKMTNLFNMHNISHYFLAIIGIELCNISIKTHVSNKMCLLCVLTLLRDEIINKTEAANSSSFCAYFSDSIKAALANKRALPLTKGRALSFTGLTIWNNKPNYA